MRKSSYFLQPHFIDSAIAKKEARESEVDFCRSCAVCYFEEDERTPFAEGEIRLVGGSFIFIRDGFKTVLLNFEYSPEMFKEEEGFIFFEGKGRKSTSEGFEIVKRKYRVEFCQKSAISEFLGIVKESKR